MSDTVRPTPPRLRFSVAPEPSRLLRARDRIREYLTLHCDDQTTIDDVVLAVEEACTNAIRHSGSTDEVRISLAFKGDDLRIAVKDRGRGFDIAAFDREAAPDPALDHGRGLFLISRLTDEMELSADGGLEVRLLKKAVPCCEAPTLDSGLGDIGGRSQVGRRDARTRALLEEIDEAFIALDWEYRVVHANAAALRFGRMPREAVVGVRLWDLLPPLRGTSQERAVRDAMELGRPSTVEYRTPEGRWLEARIYPTAAGVSIYFREIDERKRAEQELLTSRARLATALAAITDGFYTLDRSWRVTSLNDQAAAVFPSGKQALGASFWELFPEAAGSDFDTNKRRAMEEGEFCTFESYYPPFDTWFEERDYPSADGITVLFTDITERKRAEAERDRLLETTALLLETATTAMSWTDLDQMLESFGDLLVRSTDHSRVLLELWDEEQREVEIAVSRGSAPTPRQRFAFDDISDGAKEVITTGRTRVVDYAETGLPDPQKQYVDEHAFLLMLAVPIIYRERLVGLVTLDEPGERRAFSPQEIQLVEAIAGQVGGAIENARLLASKDAELARTTLLLDGATILAESTDLETGLRLAIDTMRETIAGIRAVVYGYDESRSELHVLASGGGPTPPVGMRLALSKMTAAAERLLKTKQSTVIDFDSLPEAERGMGGRFGVHLLQAIPLIYQERVCGIIVVDDPAQPRRVFSPRDIEIVEAYAAQIAAAVENTRLFDAERRRVSRLTTLQNLSSLVASSLEVESVAAMGLEQVVNVLGVTATSLWIVDHDEERLRLHSARGFGDQFFADFADGLPLSAPHDVVRAFNSAAPVVHEDVVESDVAGPVSEAYARYGITLGALIALPLRSPSGLVGGLTLAWDEPRIFTADEQAFDLLLADTFAIALENARLFEDLRQSEERARFLADVVETAYVPFAVREPDGRLILFNQAFAELTGYSRAELEEGASTWAIDITPPEWFAAEAPLLAEAVAKRRPVRYEKEYARKDGSRVPIEVFAQPIVDDSGRLVHYRAFLTDITERRRADQERQRLLAASQAQAADLAERARLAEALNAIDRLVHSTLDFDQIMQRALDDGVQALAVDAGAIEMREQPCWVVRYQRGFADADIGLCLRDGEAPNATQLEKSGEYLTIADMRGDPVADVGFVHRYGLRSVLAVPLVGQAVVIGCLLFYGKGARTLSDPEIDFARKLGATVSLACENARLVQAEVQARAETQRELDTTALLLVAADSLSQSLAVTGVLDSLARVILAAGGHTRVTISLWEEEARQLRVAAALGEPIVPIGLLTALGDLSAPARKAIDERTSALIDYDALEPGQRGVGDAFTSHLSLNVPLSFGDRFVGLLATDDPGERREFSDRERRLIEGIGAQAAVAIENARLYEQQRNIATTLQENLRHPLPSIGGLELGTVSQTAFEPELVGGDFSDVFVLADGQVAILIGDVAGKGVRAAGLTETVRSTVRALAAIDSSPAFVLRKTSEALLRYETDEPHVTAFLVVLDPATGHLSFASAGHPAPVHLGPYVCRPLQVDFGPPLGTFAIDYAATHATLTLDDYLVLYTDGVTEARRDDELFGESRLMAAAADLRGRSAQELADGLRDAALTFSGRLKDDLHIVTLRLR